MKLLTIIATASIIFAACSTVAPTGDQSSNSDTSANTVEETKKMEANGQTIVEIAASSQDFSTITAAVEAAGLVDTLNSEGPFTVFAPTDAAFERLPEGTLDSVLADKELLTSILTYHVVPGKMMAKDVINNPSLKTVQGQEIAITSTDEGVKINDAMIIQTDIEASNGVIHVIDAVLLPQ